MNQIGWHLCKTAGKWAVRYLDDGKSWLACPMDYERHCTDSRVACDLNLILVGPVSVYESVVRIEPPPTDYKPYPQADFTLRPEFR